MLTDGIGDAMKDLLALAEPPPKAAKAARKPRQKGKTAATADARG